MKPTIFKFTVTLALSIVVMSGVMPNVAKADIDDLWLVNYNQLGSQDKTKADAEFEKFNKKYPDIVVKSESTSYPLALRGRYKRFGVYQPQKVGDKDLILENKSKAEEFCTDLTKLIKVWYGHSDAADDNPINTLFSNDNRWRAIAVEYSIAYDQGSAPATKYIFCKNYDGWVPDAHASNAADEAENIYTGIADGKMPDGPGYVYQLTCVDTRKKEVTFHMKNDGYWYWDGEPDRRYGEGGYGSVWDMNQSVGVQFCDNNIEGIKSSEIKDGVYHVTCNDPKLYTWSFNTNGRSLSDMDSNEGKNFCASHSY
jgi:hypothetical protein